MLLLLLLLPAALLGQQRSATHACETASEVREALASLDGRDDAVTTRSERDARTLEGVRKLADRFPGDLSVLMRLQYLDGAEFRKQMVALQDANIREFLEARALIGEKTDEAKVRLQKLIERAPGFPQARLAMLNILGRPGFKNPEIAWTHLTAYRELCPDSVEGFRAVDRLHDAALAARTAPPLRRMLEARTDARTFSTWEALWNMEFRGRAVNEHARLRDQVREDLQRLKAAGALDSFDGIEAVIQGCRLVQDRAGEEAAEAAMMEKFPRSNRAIHCTVSQWDRLHQRPAQGAKKKDRVTYWRAYHDAACKWVERWPKSPLAWRELFAAVREIQDLPAARVSEVSESFLKALEADSVISSYPPYPLQVAQLYVDRGILLDRVPALVEKVLAEKSSEFELRKNAAEVLIDGYVKAKSFDKAREALGQLELLVAESKPGANPVQGADLMHADLRAEFLRYQGRIAAAEKRPADAFAYFWNALAIRAQYGKIDREPMFGRAKKLWADLGGSDVTWETMAAALTSRGGKPATSTNEVAWKDSNRPLPDFDLMDAAGNRWTKAALAGKVAFITIWATWCGPCMAELPHIEKLYQDWKDRGDIVMLTMAIDENPGVLGPFLQEKKYTFPVLPAQGYVEDAIPSIAIPRNWVVSPAGVLRIENLGFNPEQSYAEWKAEISLAVDKVRALKP